MKILLIFLFIFSCSDKTEKSVKAVNENGLKERERFLSPTSRLPSSVEERCGGSKGHWHSNKTKSGAIEGGFVADSAYVGESVFLGKTVSVCENANIDGQTRITGDVVVTENATIIGRVKIKGKVLIGGNATILDDVIINGNPISISGSAIIRDQTKIIDKVNISGDAIIKERAVIKENAKISGNAVLEGDTIIEKDLSIDSGKYFLPTLTPSLSAYKISKMFHEKDLLEAKMEATRKREEAIAMEEKRKFAEIKEFNQFFINDDLGGIIKKLTAVFNSSPLQILNNYSTPKNFFYKFLEYSSDNKGCVDFEQCNPFKFNFIPNPSDQCLVKLELVSKDSKTKSISVDVNLNLSNQVKAVKLGEEIGWDLELKGLSSGSIGLFFVDPIDIKIIEVFSNGGKSTGTEELTEFHFPTSKLNDHTAKLIFEGFQTLVNLCQKHEKDLLVATNERNERTRREIEEKERIAKLEREKEETLEKERIDKLLMKKMRLWKEKG